MNTGKTVEIRKTVYNRDQADKIVNKDFTTYAQTELEAAPLTISEFFQEYDRLYLDIPLVGPAESHQYLIERSRELVNLDEQAQDIQPLLDEIAELRTQNLAQQQEIIDLNIQIASAGN